MSIKMYFSIVHFLLTIILCVGIMIKLFKVKEKQKELAENANGKPPGKKQSAGELRLHKGFHFLFFLSSPFLFWNKDTCWNLFGTVGYVMFSLNSPISEILPWFNVLLCKAFWSRQHVNGHEQWNLIILLEETTLR